jgi:hypothetical protein
MTTSSALLAACSGSADANHQACNEARSASAAYQQRDVKAGDTYVRKAAQADATDPQLRQLAVQAASSTGTSPSTSPRGSSSLSFRGVGAYVALLDRCRQYQ